jgi:hypothetical protein
MMKLNRQWVGSCCSQKSSGRHATRRSKVVRVALSLCLAKVGRRVGCADRGKRMTGRTATPVTIEARRATSQTLPLATVGAGESHP